MEVARDGADESAAPVEALRGKLNEVAKRDEEAKIAVKAFDTVEWFLARRAAVIMSATTCEVSPTVAAI